MDQSDADPNLGEKLTTVTTKKKHKVRAFRLVRIRAGRINQFSGFPLDNLDRLTSTNLASMLVFFTLRIGDIVLVLEERDVDLRSEWSQRIITLRKILIPDGSYLWFSKEDMWRPPHVPWRFREIKSP